MTDDDVDAVAALEAAVFPFPWVARSFRAILGLGYSAWVTEHEAELVAYTITMMVLDEAHLLNFVITPAWHGRGLGRALLKQCVSRAAEHGAQRMFLEVRPSNTRAHRLYASCGFQVIGTRPDYYPSFNQTREDGIVMMLAW